jgi:ABC-type Fe3+ transport system permease subunit
MTEPQQYPEPNQATQAVILAIIGLLTCGVLSPYAWYVGNKEVKAIDEGRRDPSDRGSARTARILGIMGTLVLVVAFVVFARLVL